uniref:EF-hand calcium-binding domain-containing protein 12 n=1 Tax=Pristiophorus japonicus TaxID=55135 RepID=UPI00398F8767
MGPGDQGLRDRGPGDQGLRDQGPGDRGPGDQGPGDQGLRDQGPGDQGPGDRGPGDQGLRDQGPGDQGLRDQGPGEVDQRVGDRLWDRSTAEGKRSPRKWGSAPGLAPGVPGPWPRRRRALIQSHLLRVASRIFGPPKCRIRVITAAPAPARHRPRPWPQALSPAKADQREPEPDRKWGEADYGLWMAARKRQRAELEAMADLQMWINSKNSANDLELRVLENLERSKARAPPTEPEKSTSQQKRASSKFHGIIPLIDQPTLEPVKLLHEYLDKKKLRFVDFFRSSDRGKKGKLSKDDLVVMFEKANLPISDLQMNELTATFGDHTKYLQYKVLARALNDWKEELRQEYGKNERLQKVGCLPGIVQSNHQPNKVASVVTSTVRGHCALCKSSSYLKVPAVNLSERRPFTVEELEQLEKRDQTIKSTLKSKLYHMDLMEKCLHVSGEKRSMACHSLPTTMRGEMGEKANTYRQRCLMEYEKILKMCQFYGISFTERMLEKALLHPGDKLTMEPGHPLNLRQPGMSVFSDNDVKRWLSTRQLIAMEQLNHEPVQREGNIQVLGLDNSRPKEASEGPETKVSQPIAVDQLNHEPAQWKGDVPVTSELDNSRPKEASEGPETKVRVSGSSPHQSHRKSRGKGKGGGLLTPCDKNPHMTLDEYMKCQRKLKGNLQYVPDLSPNIQANPRAFWPGHMLDKVRMYFSYAKLEHEEVLFSNTQQGTRLSPSIYHNEKTWPISDQGYITYGDVEMKKQYML